MAHAKPYRASVNGIFCMAVSKTGTDSFPQVFYRVLLSLPVGILDLSLLLATLRLAGVVINYTDMQFNIFVRPILFFSVYYTFFWRGAEGGGGGGGGGGEPVHLPCIKVHMHHVYPGGQHAHVRKMHYMKKVLLYTLLYNSVYIDVIAYIRVYNVSIRSVIHH